MNLSEQKTESLEQPIMSKNALKKLLKKQQRDAKKAKNKTKYSSDEDYTTLRNNDLKLLNEAGFATYQYTYETEYPSKSDKFNYLKLNYDKFIKDYTELENDTDIESDLYYVIGRINRVRKAGQKLLFVDVRTGGDIVQLKISLNTYLDGIDQVERESRFKLFKSVIRIGDIFGFAGHVGKTRAGELSLCIHQMRILTPCMKVIPSATKIIEETDSDGKISKREISGLTNPEVRFRMRELDMIVNPHVYETFRKRSKITMEIELFLQNKLNLIKVDTPILTPSAGGATAKPFVTYSNDYACDLFLRIAPELYLKRLIVAGFPGVYEIGKQFRNESNDLTHNSEFTSLEYYMQNVDYNGLIKQCEQMLETVVKQVNGSLIVNYAGKEIDFSLPFKKLDMLDALKQYANIDVPDDLYDPKSRVYLDKECVRLNVDCAEPRTVARLLDKLVGQFVESKCINPTFITGHPQIMSPLAKLDRNGSQRTERFELFVNGTELANAYTELNEPEIQKQNFLEQSKAKSDGDLEAMSFDTEFVESLEYGLPPTGGFGMGIDRLTMFLTDNTSIREVILFPTMKPGRYNANTDDLNYA
jgi:lysyl-tRNA synthetase class 2